MERITNIVEQKGLQFGQLTISECINIALEAETSVGEVIIAEAMAVNKMTKEEVQSAVISSFSHNLYAVEIGVTNGSSFIMGKVGQELTGDNAPVLVEEEFLNKVLVYTLAAQVGNHSVGLQPCAGTGDSCPYTGLMKAMLEDLEDEGKIARVAAVVLKIGTIFRVGKSTTGCNMEGFGAGSAALAAAFTELAGGAPEQMERAIVLAISPTIANPCTPRVMVAGLCATHIGGAVMIGRLASRLAMKTSLPVTVPADVMIAMAAGVHPISAKTVVPVVIRYMEPFFKTNHEVESFIEKDVKRKEQDRIKDTMKQALEEARALAAKANSIIKPFGEAVVGGSSQAVGSPTNTARIAHFLAKGKIKKVKIELYEELFARRGINVPGILMAAVYGASTDNSKMYRGIMEKTKEQGIEVEIKQVDVSQMQRITIEAEEQDSMVEALNRGGGRLALCNAQPHLEKALEIAKELGIVIVE